MTRKARPQVAALAFLSAVAGASLSLISACTANSPLADATRPAPAQPSNVENSAIENQRIRVLILDGFSNHNWQLNTKLLRGLLQPTGLFDLSVSTAPPTADAPGWDTWRPDFSKADVVIQSCNDLNAAKPASQWPDAVKKAFVSFVHGGGGVYILHSGNNAFANWPEYNDIIGLGWRGVSYGTALQMDADGKITRLPPGQGAGTGHATRAEVLVHQINNHPIHAGMPPAWRSPLLEVYYDARGPANNVEVIAYGQDPRGKLYWPIEWTVTYGTGRAYVSSYGHVWSDENETTNQPQDLLAVDEQVILNRALQWLAKRPITVPVPANFPTADKVSLNPNIPLPK